MVTNNTELYHHGIKGMRWGVRRYRNSDGSLTAAGKKRYERDLANNPLTKEEKRNGGRVANPSKYVKEDLERTKRLADAGSQLTNNLKTANKNAMDKQARKRTRMDLSSMTDQELRNQINRELLERQYNDVFNPPTVSRGRERASSMLETAGTVLAVTSSALGIALAIKELKG